MSWVDNNAIHFILLLNTSNLIDFKSLNTGLQPKQYKRNSRGTAVSTYGSSMVQEFNWKFASSNLQNERLYISTMTWDFFPVKYGSKSNPRWAQMESKQ